MSTEKTASKTLTPPFSVVKRVREAKEQKIRVYPSHVNRASELGSDCERYLVYCRTHWDKREVHSVNTQFIFDTGNMFEDECIKELGAAGFGIIEQQRSFVWKEYQITGHIDLKITDGDGQAYPCEIKSMNPYIFDSINTLEDMVNSPKPWIPRYVGQLYIYLLLSNSELGVFYLKNKTSGQPKEIWVPLDYDRAEELIQRAERINKCVEANELPDGKAGPGCGFCGFRHICLPDQDMGSELELMTDPELEGKLDRRGELEAAYKEYGRLDKQVKAAVRGHGKLLLGDWLITGKECKRKTFEIPDTIKAEYAGESTYWKASITALSKQEG